VINERRFMLLYQKTINKLTKEEYDQRMFYSPRGYQSSFRRERKELELWEERPYSKLDEVAELTAD